MTIGSGASGAAQRMRRAALALSVLALSGCASQDGPSRGEPGERPGRAFYPAEVAAPPIALLFTDYDTNRDRRITLAEMRAGAAPSFAEADANKNGAITALEFQAWAAKALGSKDALPGFPTFDRNVDSSISRDEFMATLTDEFNHLDANKDQVLERNELVAPPLQDDMIRRPPGGMRMGPGGGRPDGGE